MQLKGDKVVQKKELQKRIHSGKRFSYGKTVKFPGSIKCNAIIFAHCLMLDSCKPTYQMHLRFKCGT